LRRGNPTIIVQNARQAAQSGEQLALGVVVHLHSKCARTRFPRRRDA